MDRYLEYRYQSRENAEKALANLRLDYWQTGMYTLPNGLIVVYADRYSEK